ncbi:MAG: aldo/keto reductase [Bdellovibrionales bacterium]|nr:aldo/keto reductase [Bdellovibrionales bacterium]
METIKLGKTEITVPRICQGTWQASGWSSSNDQNLVDCLRHGIEHGLNFIDTAEAYGNGHSEELVGQAISGIRDRVIIATKFSHTHSTPEKLHKSLEGSLKRLGTDYIDLYQQHWPAKHPALEDTLAELQKLKSAGKIRAIGVSNWMEPEWDEIRDASPVDCLQANYSLLWRPIERKVLPLCIENQIGLLAYSPLCQGLLTGRFRSISDVPHDVRQQNIYVKQDRFAEIVPLLDALDTIGKKYDRNAAQTAIRWLLDTSGLAVAITGATSHKQIEQNLGALDWKLADEDYDYLKKMSHAISIDLKPHDTLWGWHPRK